MKIKKILIFILLLITGATIIYSNVFAIVINNDNDKVRIGNKIYFIIDSSGKLKFSDILTNHNWKAHKNETINFGFTKKTFWFKFSITNKSGHPIFLSTQYPKFDNITFFSPTDNNSFKKNVTGCSFPFYHRKIKTIDFTFKITNSGTYYLKIRNFNFPILFSPIIFGEKAFISYSIREQWIFITYLAFMGFMLLLSLFYHIATKDRAFIVQFIYILLWILMQTMYLGYSYKYLWPNSFYLNKFIFIITINLIGLSSIYIYKTYLDLKSKYPTINKITNYIIVYPIIIETIITSLLPFYTGIRIALAVAVYTMFLELLLSIYLILKKNTMAIFIFVGFLGLEIGSSLAIFAANGIPLNWFIIRWANQFANIWVSSMLILAMAYKYHILQIKMKDIEKEAKMLKFAVDKSNEMAFWIDSTGRFVYVNDMVVNTLGYSRKKLLSMYPYEIIYGLTPSKLNKYWENLKKRKTLKLELVFKKQNGELILLEVLANYIEFQNKKYNCAFARDITERKNYEEEILKKERDLEMTLQSIGDAVIVTDNKGNITRMNSVAESLTGYTITEIKGKNFDKVIKLTDKDTGLPIENFIEEVISGGKVHTFNKRIILTSRTGVEYYISDSGAPIKDEQGIILGAIIVFRDITEEYILQQQLHHTQKLEAIGQLAGGIAHDFNNILGGIMSSAELIKLSNENNISNDILENIDTILKLSDRGAKLSRRLLAFSRKEELKKEIINITDIVDEVSEILQRTVDKRIKIETRYNKNERLLTSGDASQLENAILNIGLNARDAIEKEGTIIFELKKVFLDKEFCTKHIINNTAGEYAEIIISDTGTGMDESIKNRIFEPFFTTKKDGTGTGLGLSMVYGTIIKHQGGISVYTEKGVGTTFKLYLKLQDSKKSSESPDIEDIKKGQGNILIIDDEEHIQKILIKILTRLGYNAVGFDQADKAIDYFKSNFSHINMVLLDIIMPKMHGDEVFRKLKDIDSNVKVIMMSGFIGSVDIEQIKKEGVLDFIDKPFKIKELSELLNKYIK